MQATTQSADNINQVARDLATMNTLRSVRIRNQTAKGRDEIEYALVAEPSLRYVPPPPVRPAATEAELNLKSSTPDDSGLVLKSTEARPTVNGSGDDS